MVIRNINRNIRYLIAGVLSIIILIPISAYAHRPIIADGKYDSASRALQIENPSISIAVYKQVTCDAAQLWLTFDAEAGQELYLSLGVPVLDRLDDYRPALALIGPGLPAPTPELIENLPFAVPVGLGVRVFHTEHVDDPEVFYEPYSMTRSWILMEERVPAASAGRHSLVAWAPSRTTGKLWLALGETEDFSGIDPAELAMRVERVRAFHEIGGHAPGEPPVESVCAIAGDGFGGYGGCGDSTRGALLLILLASTIATGLGIRLLGRRPRTTKNQD